MLIERQKRAPRVRFRHPVRIVSLEGEPRVVRTLTANISRRGLFVHMPEPLPRGTLVAMSLEAGGRALAFAQGKVVWACAQRSAAPGRLPGCAVRFTGFLHPRAKALVGYLVDHLDRGQPLVVPAQQRPWPRWAGVAAAGLAALTVLGLAGLAWRAPGPDEAAALVDDVEAALPQKLREAEALSPGDAPAPAGGRAGAVAEGPVAPLPVGGEAALQRASSGAPAQGEDPGRALQPGVQVPRVTAAVAVPEAPAGARAQGEAPGRVLEPGVQAPRVTAAVAVPEAPAGARAQGEAPGRVLEPGVQAPRRLASGPVTEAPAPWAPSRGQAPLAHVADRVSAALAGEGAPRSLSAPPDGAPSAGMAREHDGEGAPHRPGPSPVGAAPRDRLLPTSGASAPADGQGALSAAAGRATSASPGASGASAPARPEGDVPPALAGVRAADRGATTATGASAPGAERPGAVRLPSGAATRLSWQASGGGVRLTPRLAARAQVTRAFVLEGPPRAVFDIAGAAPTRSHQLATGSPLITGVRLGRQGRATRVVVDLSQAPARVTQDGDALVLAF